MSFYSKNPLFINDLTLIKATESTDDNGRYTKSTTETTVKSAELPESASAFYAARSAGVKKTKTFLVFTAEYDDSNQVRYDGTVLNITRTYPRTNQILELHCEELISDD